MKWDNYLLKMEFLDNPKSTLISAIPDHYS